MSISRPTIALELICSGEPLFRGSNEAIHRRKIEAVYGRRIRETIDSIEAIRQAIHRAQAEGDLQLIVLNGHGTPATGIDLGKEKLSPNFSLKNNPFAELRPGRRIFLLSCCNGENRLAPEIARVARATVSGVEGSPLYMQHTFYLQNRATGELEFHTFDPPAPFQEDFINRTVTYGPSGMRVPNLALSNAAVMARVLEESYLTGLLQAPHLSLAEKITECDRQIASRSDSQDRDRSNLLESLLTSLARSYFQRRHRREEDYDRIDAYRLRISNEFLNLNLDHFIESYNPLAQYLEFIPRTFTASTIRATPENKICLRHLLKLFKPESLDYSVLRESVSIDNDSSEIVQFAKTDSRFAFQMGAFCSQVFHMPTEALAWFQRAVNLTNHSCPAAEREIRKIRSSLPPAQTLQRILPIVAVAALAYLLFTLIPNGRT